MCLNWRKCFLPIHFAAFPSIFSNPNMCSKSKKSKCTEFRKWLVEADHQVDWHCLYCIHRSSSPRSYYKIESRSSKLSGKDYKTQSYGIKCQTGSFWCFGGRGCQICFVSCKENAEGLEFLALRLMNTLLDKWTEIFRLQLRSVMTSNHIVENGGRIS